MGKTDDLVEDVLQTALIDLKSSTANQPHKVVTVALYYDHESPAISVC